MDISLTKKILIGIGLSLAIFAWAGKKISAIDQYQDVEIVNVSYKGISIIHRAGVCTLTESDLSPDAKKILGSELAEYLRLKADYDDNVTKTRELHTQQVASILSSAENESDSEKKIQILNQAIKYNQAENYKVVLSEIQRLQQERKEGPSSIDSQQNIQQGMTYGEKGEYVKAFQYFLRAAEQGNAEGQYRVGRCYVRGEGIDKDINQAFFWFQKSADAGYPDALLKLGHCYHNGQGTAKDGAKAVELYKQAIDKGNLEAYACLGSICLEGRDAKSAIQYFEKGATRGEKIAQYNLGYCYRHGKGVTADFAKAMLWFGKSAQQGYAPAQFSLGNCYFSGKMKMPYDRSTSSSFGANRPVALVTGQNYSAAVGWYQKAADQGYLPAKFRLGICYYNGFGVKKDMEQAVKLWTELAEKDDDEAQYKLVTCYQRGDGVPKDLSKAEYWLKKSAANGNGEAIAEIKLRELQKLIPGTNSQQERYLADLVVNQMAHGMTLLEIFSDHGLQEYTKESRYLQTVLEILRKYETNPPPADYILAPATEKARRDWKELMGE